MKHKDRRLCRLLIKKWNFFFLVPLNARVVEDCKSSTKREFPFSTSYFLPRTEKLGRAKQRKYSPDFLFLLFLRKKKTICRCILWKMILARTNVSHFLSKTHDFFYHRHCIKRARYPCLNSPFLFLRAPFSLSFCYSFNEHPNGRTEQSLIWV